MTRTDIRALALVGAQIRMGAIAEEIALLRQLVGQDSVSDRRRPPTLAMRSARRRRQIEMRPAPPRSYWTAAMRLAQSRRIKAALQRRRVV